MLTTALDPQRHMLIHILQGERERAQDNWSLGRFTLDFDAAPRGIPRIGVQFEIDTNGILHVLARDVKTGKEKIVEMKSAVDVDDSAVQQMVEESVEHAFEDLAARRWVESKLKANELSTATRKALQDCRSEGEGAYLNQVERALGEVEAVLAAEDPQTKTGDAKKLKEACDSLDEITKPLAELLMDKAMEAMLKKKGII